MCMIQFEFFSDVIVYSAVAAQAGMTDYTIMSQYGTGAKHCCSVSLAAVIYALHKSLILQ